MSRPVWMIHLASLLVPARRREEWMREWLAELYYARAQAGEARLLAFASGAFHDAVWQHRDFWTQERVSRCAQSAQFCVASLAAAVLLIVVVSGFLPMTRSVLMPLPYRDAPSIVTVAQSRTMAMRASVPGQAVEAWRGKSQSLEDIATYRWEMAASAPTARVSRNFFPLLGAKTSAGRSFERDAFAGCTSGPEAGPKAGLKAGSEDGPKTGPAAGLKAGSEDGPKTGPAAGLKAGSEDGPKAGPAAGLNAGPEECLVLSYDFRRGLKAGSLVALDGKSYRVAAVLERGFWFLSPRIAVWRIGAPGPAEKTGVVARMRPDVTTKEAETELGIILRDAGMNDWESLVEINGVAARVRSVLWSFGFGLGLAIVIILPSLRLRMPAWNPRAAAFFAAKTGLLLTLVLLCGIEFTRAASITMLGGTDALTEPLSTWLFMLGSMGVLGWSIADQRRRCRVCLRRLGMAAHVGCPGCLLLNWAGTELVCMEGHGMLHVPEMAACWQEPDRWTSLDDSWQGLFERS